MGKIGRTSAGSTSGHRARRVVSCVACLFFAATGEKAAEAQACSTTSKTIEFTGQGCIRSNCSPVHQKFRILGNKVLWYPDVAVDRGTLFIVGQSLPMSDANSAWHPSGPAGSTEVAVASAQRFGTDYSLKISETWSRGGQQIGEGWYKFLVSVVGCSACTIAQYEIGALMGTGGKDGNFASDFTMYACRVY